MFATFADATFAHATSDSNFATAPFTPIGGLQFNETQQDPEPDTLSISGRSLVDAMAQPDQPDSDDELPTSAQLASRLATAERDQKLRSLEGLQRTLDGVLNQIAPTERNHELSTQEGLKRTLDGVLDMTVPSARSPTRSPGGKRRREEPASPVHGASSPVRPTASIVLDTPKRSKIAPTKEINLTGAAPAAPAAAPASDSAVPMLVRSALAPIPGPGAAAVGRFSYDGLCAAIGYQFKPEHMVEVIKFVRSRDHLDEEKRREFVESQVALEAAETAEHAKMMVAEQKMRDAARVRVEQLERELAEQKAAAAAAEKKKEAAAKKKREEAEWKQQEEKREIARKAAQKANEAEEKRRKQAAELEAIKGQKQMDSFTPVLGESLFEMEDCKTGMDLATLDKARKCLKSFGFVMVRLTKPDMSLFQNALLEVQDLLTGVSGGAFVGNDPATHLIRNLPASVGVFGPVNCYDAADKLVYSDALRKLAAFPAAALMCKPGTAYDAVHGPSVLFNSMEGFWFGPGVPTLDLPPNSNFDTIVEESRDTLSAPGLRSAQSQMPAERLSRQCVRVIWALTPATNPNGAQLAAVPNSHQDTSLTKMAQTELLQTSSAANHSPYTFGRLPSDFKSMKDPSGKEHCAWRFPMECGPLGVTLFICDGRTLVGGAASVCKPETLPLAHKSLAADESIMLGTGEAAAAAAPAPAPAPAPAAATVSVVPRGAPGSVVFLPATFWLPTSLGPAQLEHLFDRGNAGYCTTPTLGGLASGATANFNRRPITVVSTVTERVPDAETEQNKKRLTEQIAGAKVVVSKTDENVKRFIEKFPNDKKGLQRLVANLQAARELLKELTRNMKDLCGPITTKQEIKYAGYCGVDGHKAWMKHHLELEGLNHEDALRALMERAKRIFDNFSTSKLLSPDMPKEAFNRLTRALALIDPVTCCLPSIENKLKELGVPVCAAEIRRLFHIVRPQPEEADAAAAPEASDAEQAPKRASKKPAKKAKGTTLIAGAIAGATVAATFGDEQLAAMEEEQFKLALAAHKASKKDLSIPDTVGKLDDILSKKQKARGSTNAELTGLRAETPNVLASDVKSHIKKIVKLRIKLEAIKEALSFYKRGATKDKVQEKQEAKKYERERKKAEESKNKKAIKEAAAANKAKKSKKTGAKPKKSASKNAEQVIQAKNSKASKAAQESAKKLKALSAAAIRDEVMSDDDDNQPAAEAEEDDDVPALKSAPEEEADEQDDDDDQVDEEQE